MIENCLHNNNIEINFNKTPCCLKHLLIMDKISEEYLLSYEFGKFLLKTFRNIFEKEKNIIKNNSKISDNTAKDLMLMISKYMSKYYFSNKINFSKYLCKIVFNLYNTQEYSKNKMKIKDINFIKNNLCCIYDKEKKYDKAIIIIKELYETNNSIKNKNENNNDYLIYLNNYINIYIKSNNKINKAIISKIELLKSIIIQKINKISQTPKSFDNNVTNKKKIQNTYSFSEIQLYLFIYYNYCNLYPKYNNNNSQCLSNFKKGYELCMNHLGENHYITLKYKNILNKSLFHKVSLKNKHILRNDFENRKTSSKKHEINSKLDEINNRLEKIGKSISPVKRALKTYINDEKKKLNKNINIRKNKSRIQLYAEDISKEEEYNNKISFNNNILKTEIGNKNYINNNNKEEEKTSHFNKSDIPKLVVNLDNHNNDNLECVTLYQKASESENEETENKQNFNKSEIPKLVINLDNHNNDNLECVTLYQQSPDYENSENESKENNNQKNDIPKLVINLDNHNNDNLECVTLFQQAGEQENENDEINNKKNDIPKLVISLDNHNNDNLECVTLFQQAGEEENNEEEKNKDKISLPKINLCLDQSNNDDYTCETFFIPTDEANNFDKKIIADSNKDKKKESNKIAFSFNIIKTEDSTENNPMNIIEDDKEIKINKKENTIIKNKNEEILNKYFIDIKFYRPIEIKNQKEEIFDISKFLNEIKDKKSNNKIDYKLRILDEKKYLLKLEMIENDSVKISLLDKNNKNKELSNSKYSYKKLLNLYNIIRHDLSLSNMQSYYNFNSFDDYITTSFLNYITITKDKNTFKFKMAKRPLGLCHCNIEIQLHFCKCVFDLIVISKNYCKIIFSSENDDSNAVGIDTYFDDESFDMLVDTELIDNSKYIYSFKNNDLNKNEVLLELIKKLQKCINSYCSGIVNVFDDIYPKTNPNQKKLKEILIFKLNISSKLNEMKLYICEFGNRLCKVVSVDQNLQKLKGIIYSCEINNLFGYETGDIWVKLFSFQKVIFGQLILNSIYFNESNSRISINKYEIINEFNFVHEMKVCNFSLIKLNENISYIKFTIYLSVGTWEYSKIIFINSKNSNINKLKLKNIKKKLVNELNIVNQAFNHGYDSFFTYLNID